MCLEGGVCPHFCWIECSNPKLCCWKYLFCHTQDPFHLHSEACLISFPKICLGKDTLAFQLFLPLSWLCVLRHTIISLWISAASTWELGGTCSLAPNFWGVAYRACLESLSGVVGPKTLTRSQYLGPAFSEIKLLPKWNLDCAKLAEQLAWVETTSLSQQGVPQLGRESLSSSSALASELPVLVEWGM